METIGCARAEELDAVLRVMCRAFGMNFSLARPIYYADPQLAPENKLVVRKDGEVVSCLSLSEHRCWIGQAQIKLAGVAGVATLPTLQRRGFASQLLTYAHSVLCERGFDLAALMPLNEAYYRRRGWETVGCARSFRIPRAALPLKPAAHTGLRRANVRDAELLAEASLQVFAGKTLRLRRDAFCWRRLIERLSGSYLFFDTVNRLQGWMFYDPKMGMVGLGRQQARQPRLQIQEFYAATSEACRAFLFHLARQRNVEELEYITTEDELASSGLAPYVTASEETANCMARIVCFERLLQALLANWVALPNGTAIALKLHDPYAPLTTQYVHIVLNGAESRVESIGAEAYERASHRGEGTAQTWAQVLVGTMGALEACVCGKLQVSTPEAKALLAQMFPARKPYLSPLDNF